MAGLSAYRQILRERREMADRSVLGESSGPGLVVLLRFAADVGDLQIKNTPAFVLNYRDPNMPGYSAEEQWFEFLMKRARETLDYSVGKPAKFKWKMDEYEQVGRELISSSFEPKRIETRYEVYMVHNSKETREVMYEMSLALQQYARDHQYDLDFLDVPAKEGLKRMLVTDRLDLGIAFRIVSSVPGEVTRMSLPEKARPEKRPAIVEAAEIMIGFIPIVGNAVAAYEAFTGHDLFGYKLSDEERGILAACVLLPMAARFVSEERAAYSAFRMSTLYGGEEVKWAQTLALGEQVSARGKLYTRLVEAERALAAGKRMEQKAAAELSDLLKELDLAKAAHGQPTVLSKKASDAFAALVKHDRMWQELDANTIERLSRLKTRASIKGQLFEEQLENRVLKWLNSPWGKSALGLTEFKGRLEFIPGYLIRDSRGLQLTDGIIVEKLSDDTYRIAAVFEAKAGEFSAQKLGQKRVSLKKMTAAEKEEFFAAVDDAMAALQQRSRRTGEPVTVTRQEIISDLLDEAGQIRSDIERLKQMPQVYIGDRKVKLLFSVKFSKMYGVVPADVATREIALAIRDAGITNFIALKMGSDQKQLQSAAEVLAKAFGIKK